VHDGASVGTVLVFAAALSGRLASAAQGLATTITSLLGSVPGWQRIFTVLDERPAVEQRPGAIALHPAEVDGAVGLSAVTFRYPGQSRPALRDVSVAVAPGETLAIVGATGADKATLGALLSRLIDPQQGTVRIDGRDVREVTLESLASVVGIVFQDSFLFHSWGATRRRDRRARCVGGDRGCAQRA
jgi:ABC-type multidrug transport system fused ATPase/permease subunit